MLRLELTCPRERHRFGEAIELTGVHHNTGQAALALTFWWQRHLNIHDAHGAALTPAIDTAGARYISRASQPAPVS